MQWSLQSMTKALEAVQLENKSLRQAAREYAVPLTTLKRRVDGEVSIDAKPGPATILTEEEEKKLYKYCLDMCDMGYGLTVEDLRTLAFCIAQSSGRPHPFRDGKAGRDWYEGFRRRFPLLVLRKEESLSYMRAKNANEKVIEDFFAKLAAILARLNILSKPMHIYNADETGISKVHKPRTKVLAKRGVRTVWGLTSGERGRTHTLLLCGSAAGHWIPPLIIYPRARMSDSLKKGAPPGTCFETSPKGWINKEIFERWLDFFVANIPSARPVLLIYDGHASHLSIEVIEKARKNDIHLLCLPSHCTHILQPLDVSVMASLKSHFSKACKRFLVQNPGRAITEADIAGLVGEATTLALTPNNLLAGFCKSGIFPLNPGRITDRQSAPSKVFNDKDISTSSNSSTHSSLSVQCSPSLSECSSSPSKQCSTTRSARSASIDSILVLPKAKTASTTTRTRANPTSLAQCITDSPFLTGKKANKQAMLEKERKKKQGEEKKAEREQKKKEKQLQKGRRKKKTTPKRKIRSPKKYYRKKTAAARVRAQARKDLDTEDSSNTDSDEEGEYPCGVCDAIYGTDEELWISCDNCKLWFHTSCVNIDEGDIPDEFLCPECNY